MPCVVPELLKELAVLQRPRLYRPSVDEPDALIPELHLIVRRVLRPEGQFDVRLAGNLLGPRRVR